MTASKQTTLHQTHELGQSIWYDNMRRSLLTLRRAGEDDRAGRARDDVEPDHLREGDRRRPVTTRTRCASWSADGRSTIEIYEQLAIEDIRGACDLMLPLLQESGGVDGRISLEVLPELATATEQDGGGGPAPGRGGRPAQRDDQGPGDARRHPGDPGADRPRHQRQRHADLLAAAVRGGRRGVPGRPRGPRRRRAASWTAWRRSPASSCRASTASATSCSRRRRRRRPSWRPVARRCKASWRSPTPSWRTRSTSARSRRRAGRSWPRPARARSGCSGRRPAPRIRATPTPTTSMRCIGADTVNTVPPATLDAFLDHGKPAARIEDDLDGAKKTRRGVRGGRPGPVARLPRAARRRREVVHHVDEDAARRASAAGGPRCSSRLRAASSCRCRTRCSRRPMRWSRKLAKDRALARIWEADATFFTSRRVARAVDQEPPRVAARAGADAEQARRAGGLRRRREGAAGYTDVVLLGMGGSSLWPEVVSVVWRGQGESAGPTLHVLDNTDPAAVAAVEGLIGNRKTLFVVASKSGGTIEIQAFERHFWQKTLARSRQRRREGRRELRRHHRSGHAPRPARRGEALPPRVHQPGRHRRALLGAVVLRPGAGGARRAPTSAR